MINYNRNPFLILGQPETLVINNSEVEKEHLKKAVDSLIKSQKYITAITISIINGKLKLYAKINNKYLVWRIQNGI